MTTFDYDAAGRRIATHTGGRSTTYAYDAAGQLVHVGGGDDGVNRPGIRGGSIPWK